MIDFTDIPTAALVAAHNACAEKLGMSPTKRFPDRATAEKRTRFILSQISPSQRPEPFREGDANEMKGSVRAKDAPHAAIKSITSTSGKTAEDFQPLPPTPESEAVRQVAERMDLKTTQAQKKAEKALDQQRRSRAAADAIAAAPAPAAAVKPSLPIPSNDPAKDAEMPALRRVVRPVELQPKAKLYPRRAGSKQAVLVDMLSRPEGATFGELYDALAANGKPWRGVTIRSGLAWDMNTIAGYGITTELLDGAAFAKQERWYEALRLGIERQGVSTHWHEGPAYDPALKLGLYRLTYPRGVTGPLPHTQKKGPTPAQKAVAKVALEAALADASKKA